MKRCIWTNEVSNDSKVKHHVQFFSTSLRAYKKIAYNLDFTGISDISLISLSIHVFFLTWNISERIRKVREWWQLFSDSLNVSFGFRILYEHPWNIIYDQNHETLFLGLNPCWLCDIVSVHYTTYDDFV